MIEFLKDSVGFLDTHSTGLTSLAALLAILIAPMIQSRGAIRQGRSQAAGQISANIIMQSIQCVSDLISLSTALYQRQPAQREPLLRELYHKVIEASLLIGSGTKARTALLSGLEHLMNGARDGVAAEEMDKRVELIKAKFDVVIREERSRIVAGK